MHMNYIYLLTKNPGKIAAAAKIFNKRNIEVRSLDFDVPEIQASTSIEIARHTVAQAYHKFKEPIVREDHSFFIDELGIPGPYTSYMEKQVSLESLKKITMSLKSTACHFELAAAYADKGGAIHEFVYSVPVELTPEPRGDESQKWNRMIRFPGKTRTFAEYAPDEDVGIWAKNYERIADLIASEK